MVRRGLTLALVALAMPALACVEERDMPERLEMLDSMPLMRALDDEEVRDSLLDVMPGGEMARGDSAASVELLRQKR